MCTCVHAFIFCDTYRSGVLSKILPGCPTGGSGGAQTRESGGRLSGIKLLALSINWSAESSQDGQEEER